MRLAHYVSFHTIVVLYLDENIAKRVTMAQPKTKWTFWKQQYFRLAVPTCEHEKSRNGSLLEARHLYTFGRVLRVPRRTEFMEA